LTEHRGFGLLTVELGVETQLTQVFPRVRSYCFCPRTLRDLLGAASGLGELWIVAASPPVSAVAYMENPQDGGYLTALLHRKTRLET